MNKSLVRKIKENNFLLSETGEQRISQRTTRIRVNKSLRNKNKELLINNRRICCECEEELDISNFYYSKGRYSHVCKKCFSVDCKNYRETHKEEKRLRDKIYREKNKEKQKSYLKIYRETNKDQIKEGKTRYYSKERNKDKIANNDLLKNYGITLEDKIKMLEQQNHKCLICEKSIDRTTGNIDHDHKTGKIRACLCSKCNTLLGFANDNIQVLVSAIKYLILFSYDNKLSDEMEKEIWQILTN